jgi:hypothetical protein
LVVLGGARNCYASKAQPKKNQETLKLLTVRLRRDSFFGCFA